jgi:predicted alpha/beta-fold hydrolase
MIKDIKSPTLFMHAQDDPLMPPNCVDFEAIATNPNTILGVTKMGGHTSYHESLFDTTK